MPDDARETTTGPPRRTGPSRRSRRTRRVPAMTNTARTSAGTDSRCTPILPVRAEVSGTISTATAGQQRQHDVHDEAQAAAGAARTRRAPRPAADPMPRPPMLATVATAAARSRQLGGAASMTAAVAVPVKMPADSPDSTRPTSSSGTRIGDQEHRARWPARTPRRPAAPAAGRWRRTSGRTPAARTARRRRTSR